MKLEFFCFVALFFATKVNGETLKRYGCPMRGVKLSGNNVKHVDEDEWRRATIIHEVKSWQMCGYFCKLTPDCKYWNWRDDWPRECELLKDNKGRVYSKTTKYGSDNSGYTVTSGNENCF